MSRKIHDIAIRGGGYVAADGTVKGWYKVIGATFRADDGREYASNDADCLNPTLASLAAAAQKAADAAANRKRPSYDRVNVALFVQDGAAPAQAAAATGDEDVPF